MKILAIYKYYWPDTTPYARLLKAILERWAEAGHEVKVLTAQPGYNDIRHPRQPVRETLGGVAVERLPTVRENKSRRLQRAAAFLIFLSQAVVKACLGPRVDLIIVNPHPPILMGLAVRLIRRLRGIPYVYHCQDIHPEGSAVAGQIRAGTLYRALRHLDTVSCRRAALIVTLSRDMRATLLDRGIDPNQIEVCNNFIFEAGDEGEGRSVIRQTIGGGDGDFVILFAGNMGRFQGLADIVEAARLLRAQPAIKFLFMGEGARKAATIAAAGEMRGQTMFFAPFQPPAVATRAMREADLSLVPLAREVYKVAYPSKTVMCLAAGSPVLAIVEPTSRLAADIVDNGLGYCCEQGDPEGVARTILEARERRDHWRGRRAEIASFAQNAFGRSVVLEYWDLVPQRAGRRPR